MTAGSRIGFLPWSLTPGGARRGLRPGLATSCISTTCTRSPASWYARTAKTAGRLGSYRWPPMASPAQARRDDQPSIPDPESPRRRLMAGSVDWREPTVLHQTIPARFRVVILIWANDVAQIPCTGPPRVFRGPENAGRPSCRCGVVAALAGWSGRWPGSPAAWRVGRLPRIRGCPGPGQAGRAASVAVTTSLAGWLTAVVMAPNPTVLNVVTVK